MSENVSHFERKTINSQLLHLIKTGNNLFLGILAELAHMGTLGRVTIVAALIDTNYKKLLLRDQNARA
jgi:hypothetical protein